MLFAVPHCGMRALPHPTRLAHYCKSLSAWYEIGIDRILAWRNTIYPGTMSSTKNNVGYMVNAVAGISAALTITITIIIIRNERAQAVQTQTVAAGGSAKEGKRPPAALSRRRHFKFDTKISVCVRSFKCFTALNIRPPEVFCDV